MVSLNRVKIAQLVSEEPDKLQKESVEVLAMNTAENDNRQDFSLITHIY